MKFFKIFLLLFLSYNFNALADVGCAINPSGGSDGGNFIYTTYLGKVTITVNDYYKPQFENYAGPVSLVNNWNENPNACPRHTTTYQSAGSGGDCLINGDINKKGNLVYYTPISCNTTTVPMPLDDYIPLLVIIVGGVGALFIKKRLLGLN